MHGRQAGNGEDLLETFGIRSRSAFLESDRSTAPHIYALSVSSLTTSWGRNADNGPRRIKLHLYRCLFVHLIKVVLGFSKSMRETLGEACYSHVLEPSLRSASTHEVDGALDVPTPKILVFFVFLAALRPS